MLVEKLKEVVSQINSTIPVGTPELGKWNFNYGKDYWQNRGDYVEDSALPFIDRQKYLLLLYKDRSFIINEAGAVEGYTFDGEIVFMVRSKISDEDYNYKYETHIKNLEAETERLFNLFDDCEGWLIKSWKETEVENSYDANMDGIKIRFSIQIRN